MTATQSEKFLEFFTNELKRRHALPKKIEISRLGRAVLASAFDEDPKETISESVFSGMDPDPSVAVLKALVERCERNAFRSGYESGSPSCLTARSDGFAAFPVGAAKNAKSIARRNAYHEAIERYVWAKWWDDPSFAHTAIPHTNFTSLSPSLSLIRPHHAMTPFESVYEIHPEIEGHPELKVVVLFAFMRSGGVISGGACERASDIDRARFRALAELSRHALAAHRIQADKRSATTFYERRLMFFAADPRGQELAMKRISAKGTRKVLLPDLEIDEPISHQLGDLVAVHRCLFKDQPPFVGGMLERLCL